MKRSRGYGLKFITKNDTSLRYDGFKDTVRVFFSNRKKRKPISFS
jgi:hypothetical protein